jgi:transcriptional regulator with XRE-family HTH domain
MSKRQTLRQVAARAAVALGYLSEIERGQKEVSSELLFSIAEALDVPISQIMRDVSDRLAIAEGLNFPDTIPTDLFDSVNGSLITQR